jgi:hypothetical protein
MPLSGHSCGNHLSGNAFIRIRDSGGTLPEWRSRQANGIGSRRCVSAAGLYPRVSAALRHSLELKVFIFKMQDEALRLAGRGKECVLVARANRIDVLRAIGEKLLFRFVVFLNI